MYSLIYTKEAEKKIKKLNKKIQERILASLERCRIRPHVHVKKLIDSPYFRLRVDDYRIIIDIKNNILVILVIDMDHRKKYIKDPNKLFKF